MSVTMLNVLDARNRIASYVRRTPLMASDWLSRAADARVSLKLESLQPTRSFKIRGAFNAALALRDQKPVLVTASTGNHGRGIAHAAQTLGLECVIFAPSTVPAVKRDAIVHAGATLNTDVPTYDDAEAAAMRYVTEHQPRATFVSPYNDPRVIAATGTIAMEILEDDPAIEVIVVPVGGGGLISGVALAAKSLKPAVRVIGVEAANNPVMSTARARGVVENIPIQPTLADAIGGNNDPQTITFGYIQRYVDDIVLVSEDDIADAVRDLAGSEQLIAEGAGAVTSAALASRRLNVKGSSVAAIVSGSNIDRARLTSVLAAQTQSRGHAV
jgi:threonine dehydratase